MKRIRLRLRHQGRLLAIVTVAGLLPSVATAADCVPSVPDGWVVTFRLSAHSNSGVVSYMTGWLKPSTSYFASVLSTISPDWVLYNDRLSTSNRNQPFDQSQPDVADLVIAKGSLTPAAVPTIYITLTNHTWGIKRSFIGQCDPVTNLLTGTMDNSIVAISFDTPRSGVMNW